MSASRHTLLSVIATAVIGAVVFVATFFLPVKLDEAGVAFIKKHEAYAPCPYRDQGGVWTIGYGMTYYYDGTRVGEYDNCITKMEADFHLRRIVREYEWSVHDLVDVSIPQPRYNALVSFAYNVGVPAFERSGLLRRINKDPDDPLIVSEFMKWVYVKGRLSKGLKYRRQQEVELYFSEPLIFTNEQPAVSYFKPDTIMIP